MQSPDNNLKSLNQSAISVGGREATSDDEAGHSSEGPSVVKGDFLTRQSDKEEKQTKRKKELELIT